MINELKEVIRRYRSLESAYLLADKNTDDYLSATCLFEHLSYRLLESDKKDRLIGFRVFFRLIKRILKPNENAVVRLDEKGDSLIVSGTIVIQQRVTAYVSKSSQEKLHSYIAKDVIPVLHAEGLRVILFMLPFALRQSLRCIFRANRINIALSITEVAEIAFILQYIAENNLKRVYDFVPYEVDSNLMYLLLRERNVRTIKIPSSGPLATHHRILIADEVVFSTPYQGEEFAKYKETIRVNKTVLWPPERAFQYYPKYRNNRPASTPNTLGFYSHGEWLRKEQKHAEHGSDIGEAERTILKYLGQFVKENPSYRLLIFPHPRETKPELAQRMKEFYGMVIAHDRFEIITATGGTTLNFDKVDIAVAAFSTILYERLFCGYKTLIGNMNIGEFPMNKSSLNNICFRTYEAMSDLINKYGAQGDDYFFDATGLEGYRAAHYPEP